MRAPCVILCLIGVYLSVLLLQVQTGDPAVPGFVTRICEAVKGCHQVLESKWASFPPIDKSAADPAGADSDSLIVQYAVPVSLLGLCYFCGLLIWFLFIGRSTTIANTIVLITCLIACLGSVWFLYLMIKVIDAACPFCFIIHAANFLLFGATLMYFFRTEEDRYQPRALYGATAVAILGLWTAIGFGWRAAALGERNEAISTTLSAIRGDIDTVDMVWRAENQVEIAIREKVGQFSKDEFDPMLHALPGFRNTVTIFGDVENAECAVFSRFLLGHIRPLYGGHLRTVWKHCPSGEKNSNSWKTARALEAARNQGKFWPFLKALLEHQRNLTAVDFAALAADSGMNPEQFDRDWRSEAAGQRIEEDIREARRIGVAATPAVYLNNRQVDRSIRSLTGFWKLQASRLRDLRMSKKQGWGTSGTGLAGSGIPGSSEPES